MQELASQRRELLAGQQQAAAELTELARRLEAVQTPMLERLRAYEQRIAELEKELSEQSKENRELLQLKIEMLRNQIETERETQPDQFQLTYRAKALTHINVRQTVVRRIIKKCYGQRIPLSSSSSAFTAFVEPSGASSTVAKYIL